MLIVWPFVLALTTASISQSQEVPTWSPQRNSVKPKKRSQPTVRRAAHLLVQRPTNSDAELLPEPLQETPRHVPAEPASNASQLIPFSVNQSNDIRLTSSGNRVTIVAKNASLNELLTMLSRSQKLNLVFSIPPIPTNNQAGNASQNGNQAATANAARNVATGQGGAGAVGLGPANSPITVSLEDVPLDLALDTILSVAGYTWTRSQGIILVTPNDGVSRLAPNAQGRTMKLFELDFAKAEDVDLAVKGLLSPVGQSFAHTSVSTDNMRSKEMVVVEDLPRYVDRIEAYIRQYDVAPRQVAIQAYVLQVDLDGETRHGVNLQNLARAIDPEIRLGTSGLASPGASQAFFLEMNGDRFDGFLNALRTTVDAKTLASPRIIAVNGQEARLQVGEQLGFRVTTTTQTSTLESVEFLNVGVVLTVTPRISRDGRILLQVQPEVSSGSVNPATGLPEEETAELQTNVLLSNGQGLVVGGLIKEEILNDQSKVPIIGDAKYIGALFQRRRDKRQRSEIIVALLPQIMPLSSNSKFQNQQEFQRASSPLLSGSLLENPRPYEPSLPDSLRHTSRNQHEDSHLRESYQRNKYARRMPAKAGLHSRQSIPSSSSQIHAKHRHPTQSLKMRRR